MRQTSHADNPVPLNTETPAELSSDRSHGLSIPSAESFILKVWLEREYAHKPPCWRGRMTHVSSGEYVYVQDFRSIFRFLASYLDAMGARVPWIWRVRSWFFRSRMSKSE